EPPLPMARLSSGEERSLPLQNLAESRNRLFQRGDSLFSRLDDLLTKGLELRDHAQAKVEGTFGNGLSLALVGVIVFDFTVGSADLVDDPPRLPVPPSTASCGGRGSRDRSR